MKSIIEKPIFKFTSNKFYTGTRDVIAAVPIRNLLLSWIRDRNRDPILSCDLRSFSNLRKEFHAPEDGSWHFITWFSSKVTGIPCYCGYVTNPISVNLINTENQRFQIKAHNCYSFQVFLGSLWYTVHLKNCIFFCKISKT